MKNLISNLDNKTNYVVHYRNLQLYLSLGMKLTKIHRVLKSKQSDWMKKYIDFNTKKRMNAANDFEKDFLKLMINSVYGKTMEHLRKRINVRLVNDEKYILKYTSRRTHITHKLFGKDYAAIHEIKPVLILNKPTDSSFPSAQFHLEDYATPHRLGRNANGGVILLYIREDIPSKLLNTDLSIEGFFVEIRLREKKWLLCSSYNPKKNLIANRLDCIGRNLDSQLAQYESFILMGDFNAEPNDANMKDFCQIYSCKNIVKDKTCFKNPINPTCIDLIITNRPKSFQESEVIETGLSDFNKMSLTVMKVFYSKQKPKITQYRKYKGFSNEAFMHELESALARFSQISFGTFKCTVDNILLKHAPMKKRYTGQIKLHS